MTESDFKDRFQQAVNEGAEIGKSTSYFSGEGLPSSGEDCILATTEDTIRILPGQTGKLSVQYLTRGGRWLSKGTLSGRHYLKAANTAVKVSDILCRTTGLEKAKTSVVTFSVTTPEGARPVSVLVFTEDCPLRYTNLGTVYLPVLENAWDSKAKTMNCTRETSDYSGLVLGASAPEA